MSPAKTWIFMALYLGGVTVVVLIVRTVFRAFRRWRERQREVRRLAKQTNKAMKPRHERVPLRINTFKLKEVLPPEQAKQMFRLRKRLANQSHKKGE